MTSKSSKGYLCSRFREFHTPLTVDEPIRFRPYFEVYSWLKFADTIKASGQSEIILLSCPTG